MLTPEELIKYAENKANQDILNERIHKIDMVMSEYGEDNFFISFSGGKDSTILHHLIDIAIPNNKIPRVYANTGIEYNEIKKFVENIAEKDERFKIIKPSVPIKSMLEKDGYPFKSKKHAKKLGTYQRNGWTKTAENYLNPSNGCKTHACPEILKYQFSKDFKLKVDYKCCVNLKEKPLQKWQKENNKQIAIIGIMKSEGGSRSKGKCLAFNNKKLKAFQPLIPITKEWENWLINQNNIKLCKLYYPPYNFNRTGCKGCPFNINIQRELDTLEKYFPAERKQCEYIWKPVYEEYRKIGYRNMRKLDEGRQMTIDEFIKEI